MEEENFEEMLKQTMKEIIVGETVTGKVVEINGKGEIFVDLGYKADGIIPRKEYSFNENDDPNKSFKVGDEITAEVLKLNDGVGNVLLSYKKLNSKMSREDFENKVKENYVFTEKVNSVNNNGLITEYKGIRIFIPMSLSGISKNENIEDYKNQDIKFKVVEYEPKERKVIGSVKVILDEAKKEKEEQFWNSIELGKEYKGIVVSVTNYGAFVDLGGVQGLLHVSGMTWERNAKPADYVKQGDEITVKVIELDKENKKIQLESKDKGTNPWDLVAEKYNINDVVTVEVDKLMPFGAFVKIENGIDGLVHISQISEKRIANPDEVLTIGEKVNAKIINLDLENKKIELSIKEIEGTSNEYSSKDTESEEA